MTSDQSQVYNAVRRVQNFLDANDAVFADLNKSATRAELNDVSSSLNAGAGSQASGKVNAKGETSNQRALRLALRVGHMRPIAAIAKLKLKTVPQFSTMVLPASNATARAVADAAVSMAGSAQQYEQIFVAAGLAPDFIANLNAATAAVRASIEVRSTSVGQKEGATGVLTEAATRGRKVLKALNSMVVPLLMSDVGKTGLLTEWASIHRITLKAGPVAGTIQAAKAAAAATAAASATTPVSASAVNPAPAASASATSTIKPSAITEAVAAA